MDGLSRILAICSIPLLVITLFLTYKFLTIANLETKEQIREQELPDILALDEQIKIYPEKDEGSETKSNQMIYDFVNNDGLDYKPQIKKLDIDQYTNLPDKQEYLTTSPVPEEELNDPDTTINTTATNLSITTAIKPKATISTKENHMVQIGAFSNKKNALAKWSQLVSKYPRDLEKVSYQVSYVKNQQYGSLYKLKLGPFKSENKAREFCKQLRNNNVSCFYAMS